MTAAADTGAWRTVPLIALCEKTGTINPSARPDALFKYVDVSSVSNETYRIVSAKELYGRDAPSRARQLIKYGDVVFATVRPALRRVAMVPLELDGEVCSTGFCVLRVDKEKLSPHFLYFYLLTETIRERVEALQTGATYPAINDGDLFRLEIPVPSLSSQQLVADVLQTVQKAKEVRQRELGLERERKAALMDYLFENGAVGAGKPTKAAQHGRVPHDWKIVPLDDCAFIQTGVAKGRNLDNSETISVPYLRVANVQDGYLNLSEIKSVSIRKSELSRYRLQQGDVLLTEGGDFDKLGRGFIWNGEVSPCVHQNHIFAVRANVAVLLPEFLAFLVQSPYGKSYFLSVAHKTTNLASINKTKLGRFPTLIPPLREQNAIAKILRACDSKIAALESEIRLSEELFRTTLEECMIGRLSVASRTDESRFV